MWGRRLTASFYHEDYRHFWAGSMIAILAFRMHDVVLGWQILEATDSAFWVGLVAFAHGLPMLIWSPVTGFLADRAKRQQIVASALMLASVACAGLALLTWTRMVAVWHIIGTSFLVGSAFALYRPARLAILPNLVPEDVFLSASTIEYSSAHLISFLGPTVAGLLVDRLDISATLMVQVLLLVLAIPVFLTMGRKVGEPGRREDHLRAIGQGWGEVWIYLTRDRPFAALLLLSLVMVPFGMSHQKLMPVFARDVLGAGASTLGLLLGASSLGTGLAGFSVAAVGDTFRKGRAILFSSTLFAGGLIVFPFSRQAEVALVLLFGLSLVGGVYLTLGNMLFQSRPPDALRGRVLSMWGMIWGILPFVNLLAGAFAESWGVTTTIAIGAAICGICCLGMGLARSQLQEL